MMHPVRQLTEVSIPLVSGTPCMSSGDQERLHDQAQPHGQVQPQDQVLHEEPRAVKDQGLSRVSVLMDEHRCSPLMEHRKWES